MSLGNGKRTANIEKRRELKEELDNEKQFLKDKKLIKEEVNRRLVAGITNDNLEYDALYNYEKANSNKDFDLLNLLFHRMFFYRLNEKLSGLI